MNIDQLILLSTYLMATSLATERFVVLVKSFIPWLANERKDENGLIDPAQERRRTLYVQLVSLIGAWATVSLLIGCPNPLEPVCIIKDSKPCLPAGVVALLSTGGSAFWNNVLGYATAVKDIKRQQRAEQRMDLVKRSNDNNTPLDRLTQL